MSNTADTAWPRKWRVLIPLPSWLYRCLGDFVWFQTLRDTSLELVFSYMAICRFQEIESQVFSLEDSLCCTVGTLLRRWNSQRGRCPSVNVTLTVVGPTIIVDYCPFAFLQVWRVAIVVLQVCSSPVSCAWRRWSCCFWYCVAQSWQK